MFLQVSALLDKELRDIFVDDIKEEYEDVRHDYNESLQVCTCFLLGMQLNLWTNPLVIRLCNICKESAIGCLHH